MELLSYKDPVRPMDLSRVLSGDLQPPVSPTGLQKPLEDVVDKAAEAIDQGAQRTEIDALLAPHLHMALGGTPRRILTDHRFWHWMTTSPLRDFVNYRWPRDGDGTPPDNRYLGRSTLNGFNRNGLTRLYWTAAATVEFDDYALTEKALRNPDLQLQLFDRRFCIDDRLARECVRSLHDVGEALHRRTLKLIRMRLCTLVEELIADCLALASDTS